MLCLEDGNVTVNLSPMPLCYAFCDPNDVTAFLFLQFHISIEASEVELLHEGILHQ